MTDSTDPARRHGRTVVLGLGVGLLCSIAVMWSWNNLLVGLLGLPEMAYRHALALCVLTFVVGVLVRLPAWLAGQRPGA